jgi:hypothetical protein
MEVREFFSDFSDRISVMIFSRVFILFYYEFYPKKRKYYKIFLEKSEKISSPLHTNINRRVKKIHHDGMSGFAY